jgi:hypothetical protein
MVASRTVAKLLVLASGIVQEPGGAPLAVSGYVVMSAGAASRIFRVRGPARAPNVDELPAATTIDLRRFQKELETDLQADLDSVRAKGHPAHIEASSAEWLCAFVRAHLTETEGLEVD